MEVNNHKAEIAKHMKSFFVNSLSVNPKNDQTQSNNSSAVADELFECVW